VKFQDVGVKERSSGQELMSVVEGYPLAIRHCSEVEVSKDAAPSK
jgi:hypothetical protein